MDPVFYEKLKAKRAEQVVDYALQLLENGTDLKTLGQVHLLREAAGDLKSLGGSSDRSVARRLLNRATREEARLTAGRSELALRIPDDLDVETGWLKSDLLRLSGENSRARVEAALFGLAVESAKVVGVPSGAVALTGVFRDLHSWSVDGVTVVFRADGRERIRILWVGQGSVDFQLVEQRRRQ